MVKKKVLCQKRQHEQVFYADAQVYLKLTQQKKRNKKIPEKSAPSNYNSQNIEHVDLSEKS